MKKKQKNNNLLLMGVVAVLAVVAVFMFTTTGRSGVPSDTPTGQVTGTQVSLEAAPLFEVETIGGRTVNLADYTAGEKPMVLYFMASTCSTCAKNWKNINEVYPEYKGKVDLVAVSVDPTDSKDVLTKLAKEKGFTFDAVEGNPQLAVKYEVKKQTAKFAIDKDGNILSRHDGLLSPAEWKELFESLL